jgi:predicted dehydrogenase
MDPAKLAAMAEMLEQHGGHPSPGLSLNKVAVERGEPLRLEIASFLHVVRNRTKPEVTGEDGRAALKLALEINGAILAHAKRAGLSL